MAGAKGAGQRRALPLGRLRSEDVVTIALSDHIHILHGISRKGLLGGMSHFIFVESWFGTHCVQPQWYRSYTALRVLPSM